MQVETGGGGSTHGTGRQLNEWADRWNHVPQARKREPRKQYTGKVATQWGAPLKAPEHSTVGYSGLNYAAGHPKIDSSVVGKAYVSLDDQRGAEELAERKAETAADQIRRSTRFQSLTADDDNPNMKPSDAQPMSWKEYNLLTPSARGAIDFNTLLARSVHKDLKNQEIYDPTKAERVKYDELGTRIFGYQGRTSDIYAPETMALLKRLKFKDKAADLDDFLHLRVVITEEDLKDIDTLSGMPGAVSQSGFTPARNEEVALQRGLSISTQEMETQMAEGRKVIESMPKLSAAQRNATLRNIGGIVNKANPGLGYDLNDPAWKMDKTTGNKSPQSLNNYFIDSFNRLASTRYGDKADFGEAIGVIRRALYKPGEFQKFLDYTNERTNTAQQFGVTVLDNGEKARPIPQFRKLMGFGEGTVQ